MLERPGLALLAIVGFSREPLEFAIRAHDPTMVSLIASEDSSEIAKEILADLGLSGTVAVVRDSESIVAAFEVARIEVHRLLVHEVAAVVVDITGGTKAMVAGVTMACCGIGATFGYVGGAQRDTLGRVVSGHERLRLMEDPTPSDHDLGWRHIRQAWNADRYSIAALIAAEASRSLHRPSLSAFHNALAQVCTGMDAWDRLEYADAWTTLRSSIPLALDAATRLRDGRKVGVLRSLQAIVETLEPLANGDRTEGWSADVLRNAVRRLAQGQVEDACHKVLRVARHVLGATPPEPSHAEVRDGARSGVGSGRAMPAFVESGPVHVSFQALGDWLDATTATWTRHPYEPLSPAIPSRGVELLAALGHSPAPAWPRW